MQELIVARWCLREGYCIIAAMTEGGSALILPLVRTADVCIMFYRLAGDMRACGQRIASCSLRAILVGTVVHGLMLILMCRRHQKGSA